MQKESQKKISGKLVLALSLFAIVAIIGIGLLFIQLVARENNIQEENRNSVDRVENNNQESSNLDSEGNEIVVEIEESSPKRFAAILVNDTISLFDENNESIPLNLQQLGWTDIKWSPDGSQISVKGKAANQNYDLAIYTFSNKNWEWITNFALEETGVDNYFWAGNEIVFMQGVGANRWLHRFSQGSVNKLIQVDGSIESVSSDGKLIVLRRLYDNGLEVYNLQNGQQWDLTNMIDPDGVAFSVSAVWFLKDTTKALIRGESQKLESTFLYKANFGESVGVQVVVEADTVETLLPLCFANSDVIFGIVSDPIFEQDYFIKLNVKNFEEELIADLPLFEKETAVCITAGAILIKNNEGLTTVWTLIDKDGSQKLNFLTDAKEVDYFEG